MEATNGKKGGTSIPTPAATITSSNDNDTPRSIYRDTNTVPRNLDSTTLHLGLKEGQIASRIVTVGCPRRAALMTKALDSTQPIFEHTSPRGFTTYTGTFEGVGVSIVAIGMGLPMMDFFVREARQIVAGPLVIARFGTCGVLQSHVTVGGVVVASPGSVLCMRNPDAFLPPTTSTTTTETVSTDAVNDNTARTSPHLPYLVFAPQPSDRALSLALVSELTAELGPASVTQGMNASACSFYSSQGREDTLFDDRNMDVLDTLRVQHPSLLSMEMETFQLFALANASRGTVRAAAASIGVANRPTGDVCGKSVLSYLEVAGGTAVVRALARFAL
jgi:uridine phosphorylase|eukprot:evm.model.NODE_26061_length_9697_cov_21.604311.4